jgi:hypothetical protein
MRLLCNGCSFTYGAGFLDHERNDLSYPGLLSADLSAEVTNLAISGSSNNEIFLRTLREILISDYDLVIVQWTELRRQWFEPCLGCIYKTAQEINSDWTAGLYVPEKDLKKFRDTTVMMTGDYRALIDLFTFCQTLVRLLDDRVVFINGLAEISPSLMSPLGNDIDRSLDDLSKKILEFDDKPDDDIRKYHQDLKNLIDPTLPYWANINDSWKKTHC